MIVSFPVTGLITEIVTGIVKGGGIIPANAYAFDDAKTQIYMVDDAKTTYYVTED